MVAAGGGLAPLLLIVVIAALGWMLFVMPQRRRVTAQRRLLDSLEVGDEILTLGGFFGHVVEINEDELLVEIAPGTNVRLARRAIAAIVSGDEEDELEPGEDEIEPPPPADDDNPAQNA